MLARGALAFLLLSLVACGEEPEGEGPEIRWIEPGEVRVGEAYSVFGRRFDAQGTAFVSINGEPSGDPASCYWSSTKITCPVPSDLPGQVALMGGTVLVVVTTANQSSPPEPLVILPSSTISNP